MSFIHILEQNYPFGTTEHTPAQTTSQLTVSGEGFKDVISKILKRKQDSSPENKTPVKEDLYRWVEDNLIDGDPKSLSFQTSTTITLGPRYSPFFFRGQRQVEKVADEFLKDISLYQGLFNRYKAPIINNGKSQLQITKESDAFQERDQFPQGLEEFTKLMLKWETMITRVSDGFRNPNAVLLGYGNQGFTDSKGLFLGTGVKPESKRGENATLPIVNTDSVMGLVEALKRCSVLNDQVDEVIESGGLGRDMSDPPFRGYFKDVLLKHPNLKTPYAHPVYESVSVDLMEDLSNRLGWLSEALVSYIRNSVAD